MKTKPPHHHGRPSRRSLFDALFVYNCLAEQAIEHSGRLTRFRADRPDLNHPTATRHAIKETCR